MSARQPVEQRHEPCHIVPVERLQRHRLKDKLDRVGDRYCHSGGLEVFDEIDSTLSLAFTDDFFAALRSLYNERAINPRYDRLTFVLLGVAAPTNLIKDRNRTPFNVGTPVDLKEFSRSDAQPLEVGL
ncbi:MAG TPA: AAA-like domain-containing protein, partial [Promineifilum sp.]|nr:AAA-like domain-containing protein [Promineifilum sp.]